MYDTKARSDTTKQTTNTVSTLLNDPWNREGIAQRLGNLCWLEKGYWLAGPPGRGSSFSYAIIQSSRIIQDPGARRNVFDKLTAEIAYRSNGKPP